jgi:AcrR family transcriptional regulator
LGILENKLPDSHLEKKKSVGRPRDEKSHQAILFATLELVAEEGLHGASIEAIARRAGVGKTTIYRHWATKEDLILDVVKELHIDIPSNDTGDFRADCTQFIKDVIRIRSSNPLMIKFFFRLFIEGEANPEFIQILYDQLFKERIQHAFEFVEKGKIRGDIRPDIDPYLVFLLVGGPYIYGLILSAMMPGQIKLDELGEPLLNALMEGIQAQPEKKLM